MDIYQQEKSERLQWGFAVIGTSLCAGVLLTLALSGCHPKASPPTGPTVIYADTTRTKLVHRANASAGAITIIHERTQQTVNSYEKSVVKFDSIRLDLP